MNNATIGIVEIMFIVNKVFNVFKPWFAVDSRALGIYRILLGILCLSDILRRWDFIDVFYTGNSIIQVPTSLSTYKSFSLLNTFTLSWEVHLVFIIGVIFSIMLIVGYRTKLSQIICAVILISLHNRAIMLENAGDFFMNCMLVWTVFLPLGISFSVDSLIKSLRNHKESSLDELNDREYGKNIPQTLYHLAFFCVLFQLSTIYFFTGLDKSGYDWMNGTAVYKMFQLDTFLTPVGYYLRDYITLPITKFFTYSTLGIEYLAPFLLLFPFYSKWFRTFFIFCYVIFHSTIRLAVKVGLFSYIMMITYVLLFDTSFINKIKKWILGKYNKKYILFYDSDCGFCHYSIRIIKRLDVFHRMIFADASYSKDKPENFDNLRQVTAILYDKETNKWWTKHEAFGKILLLVPFGFILGWIFFIPGLSKLFSFIYDYIAKNRIIISTYFGMPVCGIKQDKQSYISSNDTIPSNYNKNCIFLGKFSTFIFLIILLSSSINYALAANDGVNDRMEKYGFGKNYFRHNPTLKKISYYPRMIQRWNMFAPTVLATDKTIVVEATLANGEIINPYTGKKPILDSVDYEDLWHGHNQFWRKFFSRVNKKGKQKYVNRFEIWMKKHNNNYFEETLGDQRIKSVNIWYLSQRNADMNSNSNYRVSKRLLNSKSQNSRKKIPNERRKISNDAKKGKK